MSQADIVIRGAREHNLQNVDLTLPKNRLICMTGVSGSGKSSLAFDTLYAEGQRRYVESLSSYARQFLGQMPKPEVDSVSGLAPSISIQQKTSGRNPRSTVGTVTEIYDYLRVLFARVGKGFCPDCGQPIAAQTVEQIIDAVARIEAGTRFQILAPLIQNQKGEYRDLFDDLLKRGYLRARTDGVFVELRDDLALDRQMRHTIEVVVDRLVAGKANRSRLAESIESALRLGNGRLIVVEESDERAAPVEAPPGPAKRTRKKDAPSPPAEAPLPSAAASRERLFSAHYACAGCQISYEPPSPQLFSFNSPLGMCLDCTGLGMRHDFLVDKLVPDDTLTIAKGAIELWGPYKDLGKWRRHMIDGAIAVIEKDNGLQAGSLLKTPWKEIPQPARDALLHGLGNRHITFTWKTRGSSWKHGGTWLGAIPELLETYRKSANSMRRKQLEKYMAETVCSCCRGGRLNRQAAAVRLNSTSPAFQKRRAAAASGNGASSKLGASLAAPCALTLPEVCSLSIVEASEFFESLELDPTQRFIAEEVLKEIRGRLGFLLRCGLDYLALDRTAPTLSGGESQRIRLASQIGCGLVGVVYILDEPSIGLHPRDNELLLGSLCDLRDQGNTVIVVEHDEETMRAADHIVDFGPGPGVRGGEVVAQGTYDDVCGNPRSLTGQYLSGQRRIEIPKSRQTPDAAAPPTKRSRKKAATPQAAEERASVVIRGARHNNLKNIDVQIPLGALVCVTGVSGSGKSSLVNDILWEVLNRDLNEGNGSPGLHDKVEGLDQLDKAIDIDQSPIGRTPRSNPATYTKLFDLIRDFFTQLPESKVRGYKPGRFSFNVEGGRCEACEGHGANKLEMDFLADVWVTCPVCEGRRFSRETLEVRFKGKNINDVLNMDVQEALEHFENHPSIHRMLKTLHDVGLDYIKLGQPSPTLSGGEAQRIKLARELGKRSTGKTIYLLDEPTTGLHFADVHKLLEVLHGFADAGNTVLVVEHNLDVIRTADWIIDLGPEGGGGGGTIIAEGPPATIASCEASHTGRAMRQLQDPQLSRKASSSASGRKNEKRPPSPGTTDITIRGAAQHNLQHLDLTIPRDRISVFCGPSGSGKTSLAMDTIYAEGQRRYVESLTSYARQFLGQMPKPKVEHIHGLSPAIAIEQKAVGHSPRSTVGTVTEIYDYLRILWTRLGTPYCPECEIPVETQTTDQVIDKLQSLPTGTKLLLLSPQDVEVGQKYEALWDRLRESGFVRVRINGETCRLDDVPAMDRKRKHQVEVVVDRVTIGEKRSRLAQSVEAALDLGKGMLHVAIVDEGRPEPDWKIERFSLHCACQKCGRSFDTLTPHNFSFNSPLGWCPNCEGLGVAQGMNLSTLIADPKRTLWNGAVAAWPLPEKNPMFAAMLRAISGELSLPLDVPYCKLEPVQQRVVLYGAGERWFTATIDPASDRSTSDERASDSAASVRRQPDELPRAAKRATNPGADAPRSPETFRFQYKGLYPALEEASRVSYLLRMELQDLVGEVACPVCRGSRLRDDASSVRFNGRALLDVCEMPLADSLAFLKSVRLKGESKKVGADLLSEATSRLSFLVDVGLHYLSLARPLPTLSGGEMQRIRLAGQIGRALTGVLYVLDEPTIGLHPRDNGRLLDAIRKLRDLGNTLILVEHDREVLEAADRLFDFGPGSGRLGGTITGQGDPSELKGSDSSLTGQYLGGRKHIPIPKRRRMADSNAAPPGGGWIELLGCRHNNLRDVDLRIPLGTFTVITGVSGSGKSSLIEDTLAKAVARKLHRANETPAPHDELRGLRQIDKAIVVDQQPLGSTPASNPATYTGVFELMRELFTRLPEARIRGFRPARFSFNRPGGRCEDCEGNGQKRIEMHFLPDVWIECETCRGKRYNQETLSVLYKGKSIADVLDMSIGQNLELFDNVPKIRGVLATLSAIGLDYLTLGQSAPTLSGGEAQRVKLAAELSRPDTGRTLYILDEPTTGLHFDDIAKLLKVLNSLVEKGNTVVVIEHNLDVIKTADWIVDMGPEAGEAGGEIVAQGTPEEVVAQFAAPAAKSSAAKKPRGKRAPDKFAADDATPVRSWTAQLLAPILERDERAELEIFRPEAATKRRQGDVDINEIGRSTKMPWQTDGRHWHLEQHLCLKGQPARWEAGALGLVIDELEEDARFLPVNWNSQSIVEMTAPAAETWFLHALTGDEWLLGLKLRCRRNTFQQDRLAEELKLRSIDDLDDLPIYNRAERVRIKNLGGWQEVSLSIHWRREIDTPEFRAFLKKAADSYMVAVDPGNEQKKLFFGSELPR